MEKNYFHDDNGEDDILDMFKADANSERGSGYDSSKEQKNEDNQDMVVVHNGNRDPLSIRRSSSDTFKFDEDLEVFLNTSGSYKKLLDRPNDGSLILMLEDVVVKGNKADINRFLEKSFMPQILGVFLENDVDALLYLVLRLVLPHATALRWASDITDRYKKSFFEKFQLDWLFKLISEITEIEITQRSDLKKFIVKAGARHPWIMDLVTQHVFKNG